MYSFFGDPRDTHPARRRQDRQDFFPSFSNSLFFDPFSQQGRQTSQDDYDMEDPGLFEDHRLKPQHHGPQYQRPQQQRPQQQRPQQQRPQHPQQQHLRQQEEQRRRAFWEQQQRQNDEEDQEEDEEEDDRERLQQIANQQRQQQRQQLQQRQQRHQHPTAQSTSPVRHSHHPIRTQPPQHQHQQKSPGQSTEGSSKRNRRQRRRDRQSSGSGGEATATSAPQESVDDMQSLVEAAFGEKTMLSDSPAVAPKPKDVPVSHHEDDSDEASDHTDHDQDNSAAEDEEESIQPDPEQQQKSLVELHEIERNLQELSEELHKILSGEISNKKHILLTEENLTKAMLRIDSVESGGDDSVRRQRKGLIDKAERLLEKVDEYKHRTKTSAYSRSH
ncbi:hypothetical protein BGZ72_005136 [Mortierella alpina]|nr:hypothetical protein BGZ72_005136 [Mortierella alpina]